MSHWHMMMPTLRSIPNCASLGLQRGVCACHAHTAAHGREAAGDAADMPGSRPEEDVRPARGHLQQLPCQYIRSRCRQARLPTQCQL